MCYARSTGLTLLLLAGVGCSDSSPDPISSTPPRIEVSEQAVEATPPAVQVDVKSWEEIQTWVAAQRGKIVVIDAWSTFCLPCIQEFPQFVHAHDTLQADVACASINIDYYGGGDEQFEEIKPRVLKFLTSKQATMQNFISSDPDEDILKHISSAAPPIAIVYDREGKLHTVFNNDKGAYGPEGFNYEEDIVPLVKRLLGSENP